MVAMRLSARLKAHLEDGVAALVGGRRLAPLPRDRAAPGDVVICGWLDASERAAEFDAVISIESPDATPDNGRLRRFGGPGEPAHRVLCFYDIEDRSLAAPPRRRDVRDGLVFARAHVGRRLLIHCHAGVSRSTALALAILVDHHGAHGEEARMLEHLLTLRPQACPNRLVVRYADDLLGCRGRLLRAVEEHPVIQETRRRTFSPPPAA